MKTIATWISENPYIAAAGLIATFLGLIIAIITPIIQRCKFCSNGTPIPKSAVHSF